MREEQKDQLTAATFEELSI